MPPRSKNGRSSAATPATQQTVAVEPENSKPAQQLPLDETKKPSLSASVAQEEQSGAQPSKSSFFETATPEAEECKAVRGAALHLAIWVSQKGNQHALADAMNCAMAEYEEIRDKAITPFGEAVEPSLAEVFSSMGGILSAMTVGAKSIYATAADAMLPNSVPLFRAQIKTQEVTEISSSENLKLDSENAQAIFWGLETLKTSWRLSPILSLKVLMLEHVLRASIKNKSKTADAVDADVFEERLSLLSKLGQAEKVFTETLGANAVLTAQNDHAKAVAARQ